VLCPYVRAAIFRLVKFVRPDSLSLFNQVVVSTAYYVVHTFISIFYTLVLVQGCVYGELGDGLPLK